MRRPPSAGILPSRRRRRRWSTMKPPPRRRVPLAKNNYGTGPSPHSHSASSPQFREFFKVYIPAFSSHQLRVPPDFLKHCKSIPRKAVLWKPNGRSWKVGMIENASGLFIRSGWPEFAQANALQYGDCLIFQYDMCSEFSVKIFGRNGCLKQRRAIERAVVVKMEMEKRRQRHPSRQLVVADSRTDVLSDSTEAGSLKGDQTPDSAEGHFVSKHPHIALILSYWQLRQLRLPTSFLKCHQIKLKSELILKNKNGEKWTVAVGTKADGRLFLSSGWPKFRRDNELRLNQQCVMEFAVDGQNECGELQFSVP